MVQLDSGLTEEEFALLEHSELMVDEHRDPDQSDDPYAYSPTGFRERLALGDLSW
jgi:hypothetical protein